MNQTETVYFYASLIGFLIGSLLLMLRLYLNYDRKSLEHAEKMARAAARLSSESRQLKKIIKEISQSSDPLSELMHAMCNPHPPSDSGQGNNLKSNTGTR